jgi:NAD(P)H-hydrate epimerase
MVIPVEDGGAGHFVPIEDNVLNEAYGWADVVAIGPGLGMEGDTGEFFAQALEQSDPELPLVVDADGLNHLAADGKLREKWAGPVVVTPHPGEAARLLKVSIENIRKDPVGTAVNLAETFEAVAVLKGAPTVIADGEGNAALCPLGNPGMASGGTGDVLTGIITALLGQGMSVFSGAALGVYLHALAGDLAALDLGEWSLVAGDLVDYLPVAFGHIEAFADKDILDDGIWL